MATAAVLADAYSQPLAGMVGDAHKIKTMSDKISMVDYAEAAAAGKTIYNQPQLAWDFRPPPGTLYEGDTIDPQRPNVAWPVPEPLPLPVDDTQPRNFSYESVRSKPLDFVRRNKKLLIFLMLGLIAAALIVIGLQRTHSHGKQ